MRIMWKPKYFHEMITNSVSITIDRSASQSWTRHAEADGLERRVDQPVGHEDAAGRRCR